MTKDKRFGTIKTIDVKVIQKSISVYMN